MHFAEDSAVASKGPALRFVVDLEGGLCADMRRSTLERALINLFVNAVEAAVRAGRPAVEIRVEGRRESASMAALIIADNGPGIPRPEMLFEPGMPGLGLQVVRHALADHGGAVAAANGPNGGAKFTLTIPIV
jgi:C4-dicarboxylate-specific signal transduction histidine kinase